MTATLLSPMVQFLGLGALAAFARSDLTVPEAAGKAMAIYLRAIACDDTARAVAAASRPTMSIIPASPFASVPLTANLTTSFPHVKRAAG